MRPYSIGIDMSNLLHWQTHRLTLASGRVPLQGEASGAFQAPRVIRIAMRRNQRGFFHSNALSSKLNPAVSLPATAASYCAQLRVDAIFVADLIAQRNRFKLFRVFSFPRSVKAASELALHAKEHSF